MNNQVEAISTLRWFISVLVSVLPLIGFIMLLIWAFGRVDDPRQNWARATLLIYLIPFIIAAIIIAFGVPLLGTDATPGIIDSIFNLSKFA